MMAAASWAVSKQVETKTGLAQVGLMPVSQTLLKIQMPQLNDHMMMPQSINRSSKLGLVFDS